MQDAVPKKMPTTTSAELAATLREMRDSLVNLSLMMQDHLHKFEEAEREKALPAATAADLKHQNS